MTMHFTFMTGSQQLAALVRDFARGLGCAPDADGPPDAVRCHLPDAGGPLLHLLTHIALTAMKLGVELNEPLCQVRYREGDATAEVTLSLRLADIRLQSASAGDSPL
jgi:hypothetical protein